MKMIWIVPIVGFLGGFVYSYILDKGRRERMKRILEKHRVYLSTLDDQGRCK